MRAALVLMPLLLLGCVQPEAPAKPPVAPQPAPGCMAARLQGLIGQPRAVADQMHLPPGTRIIGPNQPVTMDFRPDRLNIEIGASGRIDKIGCY